MLPSRTEQFLIHSTSGFTFPTLATSYTYIKYILTLFSLIIFAFFQNERCYGWSYSRCCCYKLWLLTVLQRKVVFLAELNKSRTILANTLYDGYIRRQANAFHFQDNLMSTKNCQSATENKKKNKRKKRHRISKG